MQEDTTTPQAETPLGDILQPRVKRILERNGIHTVEALRMAYPHQLVTDRKFNRMRPSMARVLGLETRSAKEG